MVINIQLNERQERIVEIVKNNEPITGQDIAEALHLTRSTIRPDLAILTMSGYLDARPRVGYFFTGKTTLSYISDKIRSILVDEVKAVPTVLEESTTIYDAIVFTLMEDINSIYITRDGLLVGVASRKDLIKTIIGGNDLYKVPIGAIMTRMPNLIVTKPTDTVLSASIKIIDHEIDSLPVVVDVIEEGKKGLKVIGTITKTTITNLFIDLGSNI